jgi:predicted permease
MDPRTLLFVLGLTLLIAVTTGLAPLLHAMRADVNDALKSGARGFTGRVTPTRSMLLVLQGTLSVVLLVGAGLFVRSLWNLRNMRMGYDVEPVIYAEAALTGVTLSTAETDALGRRMAEAAAAMPGVTGTTLAVSVPFWSNESHGPPIVPGRDSLDKFGRYLLQAGSPSYFSVTGTRIIAGRGFLPTDTKGSMPIAVVSQRMADLVWPGENAIGKSFRIGPDTTKLLTVVGVAENMRARIVDEKDEVWYYLPIDQYREADAALFARVQGDPVKFVDELRHRMAAVMPPHAYVNVTPLKTMVNRQGRSWELGAKMFVGLGMIALLLAAIGLYSVISYVVAQRTRELGVRIALGATASDVVRLVLRHGLSFAIAGVALGSAIALWAGRWIEPLLFEQSPRDPTIFIGAAALLLVVAAVASVRPAFRAARVNPSQVLQSD